MSEAQWQRSVLVLLGTITGLLSLLIVGLVVLILSLTPGEGSTARVRGTSDRYRLAQDRLAAFFNVAEQSSPAQLLAQKRAVIGDYIRAYNSANASRRLFLDTEVTVRLTSLQLRYAEEQLKASTALLGQLQNLNGRVATAQQAQDQWRLSQDLLRDTRELLKRIPAPVPPPPPASPGQPR